MRRFLQAVVACLILVAVFVGTRRLGLSGGSVAFPVFITAAVLLVWAAKQDAIADRLRFQKVAVLFGFQSVDRNEVNLSTYPLQGEGYVEGAAYGELRGLKTWIFDYDIPDRGGSAQTARVVRQTVVACVVEGANLPIFQIRPLRLGTCLGDWEISGETVCFADAPRFHQRFELLSSAEEGVRRHLNARLLETIAALNDGDWIVQGYYTTVLVFTYAKSFVRPDEMEALARKGADISYAIFSAEKVVMASAGE